MLLEHDEQNDEEREMATRRIPRTEWSDFVTSFSRQHDGWLVTVEVMGSEVGAQVEGRELPLRGISLGDDGEKVSLAIMLEAGKDGHLTHIITAPAGMWIQQTAEGADQALQIESADGTRTLVRFRSAMRPEMVDGYP
jgi:hypothetical protein